MATSSTTTIQRRRSRRGQPTIEQTAHVSRKSGCTLEGDALYTRRSVASDFLQSWDEDVNEDEDAFNGMETRFFASFKSPAKSAKDRDQSFAIGDVVQIKESVGRHSLGVITALWQINDDVHSGMARVHLFLQAKDLPRTMQSREMSKNEIFYSVETSKTVPLHLIQYAHRVIHEESDLEDEGSDDDKYNISRTWGAMVHFGISLCQYAIVPAKGLFFKFNFKQHKHKALQEGLQDRERWSSGKSWDVNIKGKAVNHAGPKKQPRRKEESLPSGGEEDSDTLDESDGFQGESSSSSEDDNAMDIDDEEPDGVFASKRKNRVGLLTPRKKRINYAKPTPRTQRTLKARQNKSDKPRIRRPPPPEDASMSYLETMPKDPWARSLYSLHVAARPDQLPCRKTEYEHILDAVEELLVDESGGCIYISGVPGTGKTATVHAVVRELKRMAEAGETNPFTYVEINGLKIPEPNAAYGLLWESVSGADGPIKASAKESLKQLTRHFSSGNSSHACVVLMDELDQLVTTKQDVVYNFFNWPNLANSKLIVIAVANTMDLPERVMNGRVRSRLGMIRINFQPYKTAQLEEIVQARLAAAVAGIDNATTPISKDGVRLAAMKVSAITGDARRVLDVCRRTVELVQSSQKVAGSAEVNTVMRAMQNSPTAAFLRDCSMHERILLAALVKCIKREGVDEVKWGEVQRQHLNYMGAFPADDESPRKPTKGELDCVLSTLAAARALFVEEGALVGRKAEEDKKIALGFDVGEVERVLAEVGGQRWKNALNV